MDADYASALHSARSLVRGMRGDDPFEKWDRKVLLPFEESGKTGEWRWAVPQSLLDVMQGVMSPGKALRGEYELAVDPASGRVVHKGMMEDAGALAGALTLGAGAVPGQGLGMGFRVFHGSPHDFDKFSLEHIGKGEGAQAYGRGLYFAESEGVASDYKRRLGGVEVAHNGEPYNGAISMIQNSVDPKSYALAVVQNYGGVDEALAALRRPGYSATVTERSKAAASWLEQHRDEVSVTKRGRLYEADIDAEPEDFLDWDKPLSEQPASVRNALKAFGIGTDKGPEELTDTELLGALGVFEQSFGKEKTGQGFYKELVDHFGSEEAAARALRDAGVPGLRYLDAGSRGAGDGSRNYVVFDDKLISILSKK